MGRKLPAVPGCPHPLLARRRTGHLHSYKRHGPVKTLRGRTRKPVGNKVLEQIFARRTQNLA
jgi:hypothetical protein